MTADELDEISAIVLAGVKRLGAVEGFPVEDYALVPETDLDLDEIRDVLWNVLARRHAEVVAGKNDGSAQVLGVPGDDDPTPELGRSGEG